MQILMFDCQWWFHIGDIWNLVKYNWLLHLSALKFHPRLQINVIGLITLVLPVYRQDLGS